MGSNTIVSDISSLIQLGYKTYKVAAVSSLTFDDVASLLDMDLNKTGILTKTYLSDTIALSNVASSIYSYSCSLASPFALEDNGDYFQAHIGLNGADGTSLTYKVTLTTSSTSG